MLITYRIVLSFLFFNRVGVIEVLCIQGLNFSFKAKLSWMFWNSACILTFRTIGRLFRASFFFLWHCGVYPITPCTRGMWTCDVLHWFRWIIAPFHWFFWEVLDLMIADSHCFPLAVVAPHFRMRKWGWEMLRKLPGPALSLMSMPFTLHAAFGDRFSFHQPSSEIVLKNDRTIFFHILLLIFSLEAIKISVNAVKLWFVI